MIAKSKDTAIPFKASEIRKINAPVSQAFMGAKGREFLASLPDARVSQDRKAYHKVVSYSRDMALYELVEDKIEKGVKIDPNKAVWLKLDRAAASGTKHRVVYQGKKVNACLLGATYGVKNPDNWRIDHYALAMRF